MAVNNSYLCLDVGEKRIGVATANPMSRLAQRQVTLAHDERIFDSISQLVTQLRVSRIVVGLPRNTHGEDTAQTRYVLQFADALKSHVKNVAVEFQDEANTSQKAEAELRLRKKGYEKADIDGLAAVYILQDYLDQNMGAAL